MSGLEHFWTHGDAVIRATALLLLAMSITTWVLIFWKLRVLRDARRGLRDGIAGFWAAGTVPEARDRVVQLDRAGQVAMLVDAALQAPAAETLESVAAADAQRTRRLRDALHAGLAPLRTGQVLLASIGSTAPFIGLFGTVWGIYHALAGLAVDGAMSIETVAGPVGEALLITAAGLAVAIPAVLAYNAFGHRIGACEAELEGFAHDLRELLADDPAARGRTVPQAIRDAVAALSDSDA
jgi:biopolymer transport protein ExbB